MKGWEVESGTLTGYFVRRDVAQRALRELGRMGFRRAALVHKTIDGRIHTRDPFLLRCVLGATLAAILIGGLAGFASLVFHASLPMLQMRGNWSFSSCWVKAAILILSITE